MTAQKKLGRHRAEVQRNSSITAIAKAVGDNAGSVGRQAAVFAAASGLVLTSGVTASAAETVNREAATSALDIQPVTASTAVTASAKASLSFNRAGVASAEAPRPVKTEPVKTEPVKTVADTDVQTSTRTESSVSSTDAGAGEESSSAAGAAIVAAAYAQLGVSQDCTMLVTNSIAAIGINFRDWPAGYFSLGRTVSAAEAQPGDLAYYADGGMGLAHIAVYVGNGQAIHGGWGGNQTVLQSVNVGSGPVFIRVAG